MTIKEIVILIPEAIFLMLIVFLIGMWVANIKDDDSRDE